MQVQLWGGEGFRMLLGTAPLCSGEKRSLLTRIWRVESGPRLSESIRHRLCPKSCGSRAFVVGREREVRKEGLSWLERKKGFLEEVASYPPTLESLLSCAGLVPSPSGR